MTRRLSTPAPIASASVHNQFSDADGFYEALLDAHAGLNPAQSAALNARLILLLANQIGDAKVLTHCIALAREVQIASNE